ncbi:hypothetical protein [Frankia sp. Cas4]|uniref:hypothetical protein n=1 Tax=Frankia sp. Cas4 TaxID=3073927 RepID=UPI002AD2679E|nr:hypothetical protein [Frankia sp. Cas4]
MPNVRLLTLHFADGSHPRVPALELVPGVWLHRGPWICGCTSSLLEERCNPRATCRQASREWVLSSLCGKALPGPWWYMADVSVIRRYAADISAWMVAAGVDLTDPDPDHIDPARATTPAAQAAKATLWRRGATGYYLPAGDPRHHTLNYSRNRCSRHPLGHPAYGQEHAVNPSPAL